MRIIKDTYNILPDELLLDGKRSEMTYLEMEKDSGNRNSAEEVINKNSEICG